MADGTGSVAGVGGVGGIAGGGTQRSGGRREGRAPVSGFVAGQEVFAWHRTHGWTSAVVSSVRDDGKYLLNWVNGDETDRVKTRTNLRKGVKDQMKNSKYTGLREESVGLAAPAVVGEGEMTAEGVVKVGVTEVVISGGEVFAISAEVGAATHAASGDLIVQAGGIKLDQEALAASGLMGKRQDKKRSLDGEGEEEESQADIHGGSKGAVPPPVSAGGWNKSEHQGLLSMWFQHKRWYHCEACDYLNDRLYHRSSHF